MKFLKANIWSLFNNNTILGVPTNMGWNSKNENIMGKGLALQVKEKFPDVPKIYGNFLQQNKSNGVLFLFDYKLIMLPTKPLNTHNPQLSCFNNSSIVTIENTLQTLSHLINITPHTYTFILPLLGAGAGNLNTKTSKNILQKYLSLFDNVLIVDLLI